MDVKEVVLKYSIHKCSSCSSSYLPELVIIMDTIFDILLLNITEFLFFNCVDIYNIKL